MALVDNAWYVNYGNGSTTGWWGVTAWTTGATIAAGALRRQVSSPTVGNERVFVAVVAGTTHASTQPTWILTRGAKTTDNTVTWQECTGVAALNGDLTNTPNWTTVKNTAVTLGQVIQRNNAASYQICTTAGTAGNGSEPSFSDTAGATTADNTVTWTSLGAVSNFTGWQAPHARLAKCVTATWAQAGNTIYVASIHAETGGINAGFIASGIQSVSLPIKVLCVNEASGHVPPIAGDLATTATITSTTTFRIQNTGIGYIYGITFIAGSGSSASELDVSTTSGSNITLDACSLQLGTTDTSTVMNFAGVIILKNTTLQFANASQAILSVSSTIFWTGTASAISGATLPTTLVTSTQNTASNLFIEGVDLSALGSGKTLIGDLTGSAVVFFKDCKLGSSVTIAAAQSNRNGAIVTVINSDSTNTNTRGEKYVYWGTVTTNTTIVRTSGASNGVTGVSWKMAPSSITQWFSPLEAQPIAIWNPTTGSNVTVTIEGLQDPRTSTSLPNNDDIWMRLEYLGSSSTPLGTVNQGTKANYLAANAALTASTQAWDSLVTARANTTTYSLGDAYKSSNNAGRVFICTTAGTTAGSEPGGVASAVDGGAVTDGTAVFTAAVRFKQQITLSSPQPGMVGYIYATIKAAKASAIYYIDPLLTLS